MTALVAGVLAYDNVLWVLTCQDHHNQTDSNKSLKYSYIITVLHIFQSQASMWAWVDWRSPKRRIGFDLNLFTIFSSIIMIICDYSVIGGILVVETE